MKRILLCVAMFSVVFVHAAFAADSTSFDPLPVSIKAMGGGVPVGTVISWPVATNPENYENWLECDGQTISQAVYPELFAVVGAKVPDLRGLFLRGVGGNAGVVGVKQAAGVKIDGGAIASIGGGIALVSPPVATPGDIEVNPGLAAFPAYIPGGNSKIDVSINVNAGDETRPVNMAVRYLIRARP